MKVEYAIVFVSDMSRSVAFYRDVFGLPLKFETPGWTEFATEGATLAPHATDVPSTGDGALDDLPAGRCRTGFSVEKLDEFHAKMLANDVTCAQQPSEVFGVRIAQYVDPDGMALGVSQAR